MKREIDSLYVQLRDEKILVTWEDGQECSDLEAEIRLGFVNDRLFEYLLSIQVDKRCGRGIGALLALGREVEEYPSLRGALLYILNRLFENSLFNELGDFFSRGDDDICYYLVKELIFLNSKCWHDEEQFKDMLGHFARENTSRVRELLFDLGVDFSNAGYSRLARICYEQCMSYTEKVQARNKDMTVKLSDCYNNLGLLCMTFGDMKHARVYYEKTLELYEKMRKKKPHDLDMVNGSANAYNNLGMFYTMKGDVESAKRQYNKCLALYRAAYDRNPESSDR